MLLKGQHKSMRASWGANVIDMGRALVGWDRSQPWNKEGYNPTYNSIPTACLKHVCYHMEGKDLQMSVYHHIQ